MQRKNTHTHRKCRIDKLKCEQTQREKPKKVRMAIDDGDKSEDFGISKNENLLAEKKFRLVE